MLGPSVDDENILKEVECTEALMHFLGMPWKVIFAVIPPRHMCGGWLAFVIALAVIGAVTTVVGELATMLGCTVGLKVSATAITLVAMGTSLPDTFASKAAAQSSPTADSAIVNVTGSNSVNVFLGMGLPWVLGTAYWHFKFDGAAYEQPAGSLAFAVIIFLICSLVCLAVLALRRLCVKGELGGAEPARTGSAILLAGLWVVFIVGCFFEIYAIGGFTVPESILGPKFYSDQYPEKYPKPIS